MQIFKRFGYLHDDVPREVFAEVCETYDLVEQFAARAQLQHDKIVLPRLAEINEFDDIGMIQLSHNLNLFEDVCTLVEGHIRQPAVGRTSGVEGEGRDEEQRKICRARENAHLHSLRRLLKIRMENIIALDKHFGWPLNVF